MDPIMLLKWVLVFAVVAYGLWYVCTKFQMPTPVFWICGAVLLIILLSAVSGGGWPIRLR